ncbi:MAG: hypothetical protein ACREFD_05115 [Stellaceae bacterium]
MTQLWRIHIRPGEKGFNTTLSYELCLKEKVIGVGWQVEADGLLSLEKYLQRLADTYPEESSAGTSAVRLLAQMGVGDLVWMRSRQGVYHLCKVKGPWEYRSAREYRDVDVVNIRTVRIVEVGVEIHVPGKVIACFRPPKTVQRIKDDTALDASERIWTRLTGGTVPPPRADSDIFSLISDKDCEDLISVYLQMQGWVVYPARRRADMPAYEFVLRHRSDSREAVVQVKTGGSTVDLGALPASIDVAFAFQPNGRYAGEHPRASIIKREDVLQFIASNPRLVPDAVLAWSQ